MSFTIAEPPIEAPIEFEPVTIDELTNFVENHGWAKGRFVDEQGGYCLSWSMALVCGVENSAINIDSMAYATYAMRYRTLERDVINKIVKYTDEDQLPFGVSILGFNDAPTTTKEDVLKMLRS